MKPIRKLGRLDPNFAWDGERICADDDLKAPDGPSLRLRGSATLVGDDSPPYRIVRDPLGINKLFWVREEDGCVTVAARPRILTEQGHSLGSIRAVPRGSVIDLDSTTTEPAVRSLVPAAWTDPKGDGSVEAAGGRIRRTLDGYLAALASAYPSDRAFICLSGGLDSSLVAVLAREHFPDAVAVSFDLDRAGAASDDRLTAERLARDLGMPLLEATVSPEELLSRLDTVLVEGIDWRDFNVHAGLVNAALAGAIAEAVEPGREAIVFTGDLANEFLVDYQPETYRGTTYYELPDLRPRALRSALVKGLDSCHREIGVFGAWGLSLVQPYAVAVDDYLALPEDFLRVEDRKGQLCRAVCGSQVPSYIHSRPKARAQMGGEKVEHSVLASCVDRGVDSQFLRQRFAALHGLTDPAELDRFVRAGRYRASAPTLASPL